MDTKGNIRHFDDAAGAMLEVYDKPLTLEQAEVLEQFPPEKRNAELVRLRHAEYLEKLKADGLQGRWARRVAKRQGSERAHKCR
jgi:hypothetical protein